MLDWLRKLFFGPKTLANPVLEGGWDDSWSTFLNREVAFYRALDTAGKTDFERRVTLFLETTPVTSGHLEVSAEDCLLVASSAVIPVWAFPNWHYFNVSEVVLTDGPFPVDFDNPEFMAIGLAGMGVNSDKVVLSQPDLHLGFKNSQDKKNVGIHEFVHMIDFADGAFDGFPELFIPDKSCLPWFGFMDQKIREIWKGDSNIDPYGGSNKVEFLAVASEYFFERPAMLNRKHPELYEALHEIYRIDMKEIALTQRVRRKGPCPCGSGKRYKRCCEPAG